MLSGLHTANLSRFETHVGKPKLVCVNGTKTGGKHVCKLLASNSNVFADCFYAVHTHQVEFANTRLPTLVCRVKAAFQLTKSPHRETLSFNKKQMVFYNLVNTDPEPFIHKCPDL